MTQPDRPVESASPLLLNAQASGDARVFQAARDQYIHLHNGSQVTRRTVGGDPDADCPYPGLAAFDTSQARWYFGRDPIVTEAVMRLDNRVHEPGPLAVIAPSGAGKTSLLRAGLIPALAQGALPHKGSARWPPLYLTPTAHPMQALANGLSVLTGAPAHRFTAAPAQVGQLVESFLHRRDMPAGATPVLIVDQFEETFTMCADADERAAFVDALMSFCRLGQGGTALGLVVLGLRADFYASCIELPPIRDALRNNPVIVPPMSEDELRQAIVAPAALEGLDFEPGLVEILLHDLGVGHGSYAAGRLPMLAYALRSTWQARHGHQLTVAGYQATGGIRSAIGKAAELTYSRLGDADQKIARTLFLRLVHIAGTGEDTRRRLVTAELSREPGVHRVLDAFTASRLLTQEQDTVEITHEVLLRGWPRLHRWIDDDRAGNVLRQDLEDDATSWERAGRPASELYRGNRLTNATDWADQHPHDAVSQTGRAFLRSSIRHHRRSVRVRRATIALLAVLTLVAGGVAAYAYQQRATAQNNRDEAEFTREVFTGDRFLGTDSTFAMQSYVAATRHSRNDNLDSVLVRSENIPLSTVLATSYGTADTASFVALAYRPASGTLAVVDRANNVLVWSADELTAGRHPPHVTSLGSGRYGRNLVFSPNGRLLVIGRDDGTFQVWNATDPKHLTPFGQPVPAVANRLVALAFEPKGRFLVTGGGGPEVRLWDLKDPANPKNLGELPGIAPQGVLAVAACECGFLALSDGDAHVRLWDARDPGKVVQLGRTIRLGDGPITALALSPNGRVLAVGGLDGKVWLENLDDPAHPHNIWESTFLAGEVNSLAFDAAGDRLAAGLASGQLALWRIGGDGLPQTQAEALTGHGSAVSGIAFDQHGDHLLGVDLGGSAQLWQLPRTVLRPPTPAVAAVYNGTGDLLAVQSADGAVRFWDTTHPDAPRPLTSFIGPNDCADGITFHPKRNLLACHDNQDQVRFWDMPNPDELRPLRGVLADTVQFAFGPTDNTMVTMTPEHTLQVWSYAGSEPHRIGAAFGKDASAIAATAFGQRVAAARTLGDVQVWDLTDPASPRPWGKPLTGNKQVVLTMTFSPDNKTLAAGGQDHLVRLWDVATPGHSGDPLSTKPLSGSATGLDFTADSTRLVTAGLEQSVHLWDVTRRDQPADIYAPLPLYKTGLGGTANPRMPHTVKFDPRGSWLVTALDDGEVDLWNTDPHYAVDRICTLTNDLDLRAKWTERLPDIAYPSLCGWN